MTGLALLARAVTAGGARPARAETLYTLKDLGTLPGGTNSFGNGINAAGQVTGFANPTAISSNHAPSP
jgi:uncharacterized membrane protein